jgi:hypothetical protein
MLMKEGGKKTTITAYQAVVLRVRFKEPEEFEQEFLGFFPVVMTIPAHDFDCGL